MDDELALWTPEVRKIEITKLDIDVSSGVTVETLKKNLQVTTSFLSLITSYLTNSLIGTCRFSKYCDDASCRRAGLWQGHPVLREASVVDLVHVLWGHSRTNGSVDELVHKRGGGH